jgi:hypothetical protein
MMDESRFVAVPLSQSQVDTAVSDVLRRVYGLMTLGLLVTAIVAYYVATSVPILTTLINSEVLRWAALLVPVGIVFFFYASIQRVSPGVALTIFLVYSAANGVMLSFYVLAYTGVSIAVTFAVTGGMFAVMSVVGYTTRTDLTRYRSFFLMGLIGLLLASAANIFLGNTTLDWVLTYVGIGLFLALTAYDVQMIRGLTLNALLTGGGQADSSRVGVIGALALYLDFINLFVRLLRIFGRRR